LKAGLKSIHAIGAETVLPSRVCLLYLLQCRTKWYKIICASE